MSACTILDLEQRQLLVTLLSSLTDVCDHANSVDRVGFSKSDLIGHYLVEMPDDYLNDDWALVGIHLAHKYRNQLTKSGLNPEPFVGLYDTIDSVTMKTVVRSRNRLRQRRIILDDAGNFTVHYPQKVLIPDGLDDMCVSYDFIARADTSHGYSFTVLSGARAYARSLVDHDEAKWFIPDNAWLALNDERLDTIDVTDAIPHDIYIRGESFNGEFTLSWSRVDLYLELVRSFSRRSFDRDSRCWKVTLKTPSDLDVLLSILKKKERFAYMDTPLWDQIESVESLAELRALLAESETIQKEQDTPRCAIALADDGRVALTFTKFDYSLLSFVKSEFVNKRYLSNPKPHWSIEVNNANCRVILGDEHSELFVIPDDVKSTLQGSLA